MSHCSVTFESSTYIVNSQKDQYYNGNWNGNDCADPQTTFETIAYKLEDLVAAVSYKFFKEDNEYFENDPKLLKKFWSQTDSLKYGRCFTLVPTSEHIKLGIQKITIRVSSDLKLFFHTPGIFITTRKETEVMEMQSVSLGYSYDIGIQHDLFNIINDESICTAHSKYSKDQCANKEVDEKSLEYFGCTSPYGPNKTQICQNPDIGLNVTKLYEDTIEKHNSICLNPCSFLSIKVTKSKETFFTAYKSEKKSYIQIVFRETVKVTTGYYLYNGLTLFAQIGGYIGLGRTIVWAYDKTVAFVEQSKLIFSKHQQKSMIA